MRPRAGLLYLSGAASSKARRASRMGRYLSAITADDAAKQVFPNAPASPNPGHNMDTYNVILASARAGQVVKASGAPIYIPGTGDCAASGVSSNVKLAQVSGTMALTGINVAAALSSGVAAAIGTALGPLTLGLSTLIGLFPLLFGHHAAAVKKEQSILCTAVPAANNYLQIIDQAVTSGQVTPQQGIAALNSLLSDFGAQVAAIRHGADPTVSGECNAACVMYSALKAVVLQKASQYQDLATAAASAAANPVSSFTSAVSSAVASAGLPAWFPYAAGAFLLWELL